MKIEVTTAFIVAITILVVTVTVCYLVLFR